MARPRTNTNRENIKSRNFIAVIYPDAEDYNYLDVLENVRIKSKQYVIAYHDKDRKTAADVEEYKNKHNEELPDWDIGSEKKPHFHILIVYHNTVTLGQVSRDLDINSRYIEKAENKVASIQYFIHRNNPEKFQYNPDEMIETNIQNLKKKYLDIENDMKADSILQEILDRSTEGKFISITSIAQWTIYNNCWDEFRRGQHIWTAIISECNQLNCKGE